jgi:hypothetical protein
MDVRWLSHEKAVANLRRCLPSVVASLEREAEERNCAQATGLVSFVKRYKFVASLYMMSDILPPLANLSRAFQRKDVDFTVIKPLVQATKATIDSLLVTPGEHFSSLANVLPELRSSGINQPSAYEVDQFRKNVYEKYLHVLSDHITGRFPDITLLDGFRIFDPIDMPQDLLLHATHGFDPIDMPQDLLLHATHGFDSLQILTDHYGPHSIVNPEASRVELKTFNSIVASNVGMKEMTSRGLMSHLLKVKELSIMFPNLTKLAAIGLLLPVSTVDCERGFSTLTRVKTDL